MINLEKAVESAKTFLNKMKGLNVEFNGRPLMDWLDFEAVNEKEDSDNYYINCRFRENLFSTNRVSFRIKVSKETGEITDVKRVQE